jgi:hypothetical protein
MAKERVLPNLANETLGSLLDKVKEQRDIQKDAKFLEGLYKEAMDARMPEGATSIESEKHTGQLTEVTSERLDTDAIKSAFSRDDLIAKGFLKVSRYTTLKILERPVGAAGFAKPI